jgi:hypothetical protein
VRPSGKERAASKGITQSNRCQFARVPAYGLGNLPQDGSPFEWMNVSPKLKPVLSGRDDRSDIRHATIGDFTEALTSARTLEGDVAPGFRFVPSTVVVQSSIRRWCLTARVRAGSNAILLRAGMLHGLVHVSSFRSCLDIRVRKEVLEPRVPGHNSCSAFSTSPARSPMTTQGAIVFPVVTRGRIDPSAIRRLSTP